MEIYEQSSSNFFNVSKLNETTYTLTFNGNANKTNDSDVGIQNVTLKLKDTLFVKTEPNYVDLSI